MVPVLDVTSCAKNIGPLLDEFPSMRGAGDPKKIMTETVCPGQSSVRHAIEDEVGQMLGPADGLTLA